MANSDYTVRGSGSITPSAFLAYGLTPASMFMGITDFNAPGTTQPTVGMGVMVGGEIMRVDSVDGTSIGIARGCADTVPASHAFGEMVWFLTDATGSVLTEYAATETVGVKVLMRSSSTAMGVENSPPNELTFNRRFARPYPPGNVIVNELPFHSPSLFLDEEEGGLLNIAWSHRNRLTQGDVLIAHDVGTITPEVGTTYVLRVYDADNVLRNEIAGITGESYSYTIEQATLDLESGTGIGVKLGYLTLHSVRDGFESWQGYRINFTVDNVDVFVGWGYNWGLQFGN